MQDTAHLLQELGERLRQRRRERGLTQAELARLAHLSPRFLVQLEGGTANISVQRLAELSAVLGLTLTELFQGLDGQRPARMALVGMRGAGKSSVGARLAARLGAPLVELDQRIEALAGVPLPELFALWGEERYRELEARALDEVLAEPGPRVLATGGSIVTAEATWRRLRESARTVWLRASPERLLDRVRAQGDLRPMAGRVDPLGELRALLDRRAPLYALAHRTIDTDGIDIDGVVAALERAA